MPVLSLLKDRATLLLGRVPRNALTLNGAVLTLNGSILTLQAN